MKTKEIRTKTVAELESRLEELSHEVVKLNTQRATGTTLKSPGQVKKVKRTVARIKTIINQKKSEGMK